MKKQEHIPDKIQASGRKLPFEVPDSYFSELPEKIQQRLSQDEKPVTSPRFIRPKLAMAAMFIGILTLGYAGIRILLSNDDSHYMSEEEIVETIEYFSYELDNGLLATVIIESDITLDMAPADSHTDEIIQYLSEDEIDFSNLLNDF